LVCVVLSSSSRERQLRHPAIEGVYDMADEFITAIESVSYQMSA